MGMVRILGTSFGEMNSLDGFYIERKTHSVSVLATTRGTLIQLHLALCLSRDLLSHVLKYHIRSEKS